jgi:hypothetical protein
MRLAVLAALLLWVGDARAEVPTTMYITNLGTRSTRVQVALGSTAPCDSRENQLIADGVLQPGERRTLLVNAIIVCARNTSGGSTIDWTESQWLWGGRRCRNRRCWADPSVPIVFDVRP